MTGRPILACIFLLALGAPSWAKDADVAPVPQIAPSPPATSSAPADDASPDALFDRLAQAKDPDEADGVVARIDRLNRRSGSDTDDLLLSRATTALDGEKIDVSLQLLDALVAMNPGWAEAWSLRANAHFDAGDANAAMIDLARALADDPRHLKALADLGAMFENAGRRENALKVYERALEIAPQWRPAREAADRVRAALAGQAL